MKIVVDTSVIIAVVTNEPHKKQLIEKTKGCELVAPAALHWEIGNAFSAMLRRNRITLEDARAALREYLKIPIRFQDVALEDAIVIADKCGIYAYDAYFIACANRLNLSLVTLDNRLAEKAKELSVTVEEL